MTFKIYYCNCTSLNWTRNIHLTSVYWLFIIQDRQGMSCRQERSAKHFGNYWDVSYSSLSWRTQNMIFINFCIWHPDILWYFPGFSPLLGDSVSMTFCAFLSHIQVRHRGQPLQQSAMESFCVAFNKVSGIYNTFGVISRGYCSH